MLILKLVILCLVRSGLTSFERFLCGVIFLEFITGNSNERIKNIVNLVKDKKTRQKQGLFVIEGLKIILEAKKTNIKIKTILLTEKFFKKNKSRLKNILDNTLEIIIITEIFLKKFLVTLRHKKFLRFVRFRKRNY